MDLTVLSPIICPLDLSDFWDSRKNFPFIKWINVVPDFSNLPGKIFFRVSPWLSNPLWSKVCGSVTLGPETRIPASALLGLSDIDPRLRQAHLERLSAFQPGYLVWLPNPTLSKGQALFETLYHTRRLAENLSFFSHLLLFGVCNKMPSKTPHHVTILGIPNSAVPLHYFGLLEIF